MNNVLVRHVREHGGLLTLPWWKALTNTPNSAVHQFRSSHWTGGCRDARGPNLVKAEIFLATHVHQIFRLSCFRICPTELRTALAIGTLSLLRFRLLFCQFRLFRLF